MSPAIGLSVADPFGRREPIDRIVGVSPVQAVDAIGERGNGVGGVVAEGQAVDKKKPSARNRGSSLPGARKLRPNAFSDLRKIRLMRAWEEETERLIDLQAPREP